MASVDFKPVCRPPNMKISKIVTLAWLTLLHPLISRGDEWPHFLGPHADTSVREPGLRTEFPDSGLPLLWERAAGGGYSGPAVVDGRVFLIDRLAEPYRQGKVEGNPNFIRAAIPGRERVRSLDAETGEPLWEHNYACPYSTVSLYAIGPRCTPTVNDGRVYTLGAEGNLFCLNAKTGHVLWSRDFKKDYALKIAEWGCAAHPLVHGDQLICIVGGDGSTVVSFDKVSGKERWRALSSSKPGYCPPVVARIHGQEQLLVWHGDGLAALNPGDGTQRWFVKVKPSFGMAIGAPRVHDDLVHVMGYKGVSAAIRVAPDTRSAKLVWGRDLRLGVAGVLNTAHLDANGHLYSAGGRGRFQCVDIRTGERLWETPVPLQDRLGRRTGAWPSAFSFPHPPSGRTFLYNDHGELITAELSPGGYKEISRAKLIDPTHEVGGRLLVWSAPAFANKKLYLRNDRVIRCFDLSANSPDAGVATALLATQKKLVENGDTLSNAFRLTRRGEALYHHTIASDTTGDHAVTDATLFAIWSMTKPITSVAAMMLHERGVFHLDDPVSKVVAQLANLRVKKPNGKTVALKRQITYRDLLRHTSGIAGYDGSFDKEGTWKEVMELGDLAELIDLLEKKPLEHQPGERFTYGLSTAVLGRAIEIHTGRNLAEFFDENIFKPLSMKETRFHLTPKDRKRFQPLFVKTDEAYRPGTLKEDELYYAPESRLYLGGEGLVSTMNDYGRFCQMLVDRGRAPDGTEILSEETLALMLSDQLKEIPGFNKKGHVMGLGFEIFKKPPGEASGAPSGIFGWGGYHTTTFWIDPSNALYGLFMTRRYPFLDGVEDRFKSAYYSQFDDQ